MHRVLLQFTCNPKIYFYKSDCELKCWSGMVYARCTNTFIFQYHPFQANAKLKALVCVLVDFESVWRAGVFVPDLQTCIVRVRQHILISCLHKCFFFIVWYRNQHLSHVLAIYMYMYVYLWKCHSWLLVFNFSKAFCRNSVTPRCTMENKTVKIFHCNWCSIDCTFCCGGNMA